MNIIDSTHPIYTSNINEKKNKKKTEKKASIFQNQFTKSLNNVKSDNDEVKNINNDSENNEIKDLSELLNKIASTGENLKKSLSMDDLNEYKTYVKEYISKLLNEATEVENKVLYNSLHKQKVSKIHVNIINKELLNLTNDFFEDQKKVFKIIQRIDYITGMIINLKS